SIDKKVIHPPEPGAAQPTITLDEPPLHRRLSTLLSKLAITYEEYRRLHPRTRKKRNDPMFTDPRQKARPEQKKKTVAPKTKAPAQKKVTLPPTHYNEQEGRFEINM